MSREVATDPGFGRSGAPFISTPSVTSIQRPSCSIPIHFALPERQSIACRGKQAKPERNRKNTWSGRGTELNRAPTCKERGRG